MRVLKLWIVVVSTPSFCLAASIWSRFCRCDRTGARRSPGSGQHEVGHRPRAIGSQKLFFIFVVSFLRFRG